MGGSSWAGSTLPQDLSVEGEHCLVCGKEMPSADHVRLHRGRTVNLCSADCAGAFEADTEGFFASLQPKAALFQEPAAPAGPLGRGWFTFGLAVLAGLIFGALTSYLAIHRGHAPRPWFFAGLLLNVLGLALLLTRPRGTGAEGLPAGIPDGLRKVPTTRDPVPCSRCGHGNHPSAGRCGACHATLSPSAPSEVEAARASR